SVEVVNGVFTDCTALETVVLEPGVKTIGEQAFRGDTALKNVTIPDTVTEIGEYAFLDTAIESIVIPDSVESIGVKAFCQCDELKTVYYTGSEEDWNNKSLGDGLVTYDPETGDDVPMDVEIVFNYGAEQPATPTEKEPSVCGYCGQVHDTTVVKEFFVSFLHTMLYIGKVFLSISTFGLFD
ncbi:MAG: leucine-rich repeat domain-containing protein, partial [Clostridia bacterium]|nr:leucine-rich repeat domain-containing protein [Clostridia bacterium]